MGFLGISYFVWAGLALVLALVFVFVVPNAILISGTQGIHFFVLRWFHSLIWVVLALSFVLRGTENDTAIQIANLLGPVAGLMYIVYIVTLIRQSN